MSICRKSNPIFEPGKGSNKGLLHIHGHNHVRWRCAGCHNWLCLVISVLKITINDPSFYGFVRVFRVVRGGTPNSGSVHGRHGKHGNPHEPAVLIAGPRRAVVHPTGPYSQPAMRVRSSFSRASTRWQRRNCTAARSRLCRGCLVLK